MGGGKGGDGGAGQARADEQARQDKIRQGTARINSIFDGSVVGDGALSAGSAYDPTATYYNADGSVWTPTPTVARSPSAPAQASAQTQGRATAYGVNGQSKLPTHAAQTGYSDRARAPGTSLTPEQQYAQALGKGLYSGTKSTGGFTDDYFAKQRDSFIDYATPQLDEQFGDANKQLTFSLARSGLTDSSVRGEKASELQQLYDLNKQKVADEALGYETKARNSVEDARTGLIQTLNATGDAEGAANSALARSQALSQPAAFSPLSQLFADFTSGLGTQAAAERSFSAGGSAPTYTTGLFDTSKNAVKVA